MFVKIPCRSNIIIVNIVHLCNIVQCNNSKYCTFVKMSSALCDVY